MAEQYVQLALSKIGADTPTTQTILRVGVDVAQAVNKSKDMNGAEKMALVQQTLRNVLEAPSVKEKLSADAKTQLNTVINDVIPPSITLVVEAGRGHYDFKKPSVSCAVSFITMLFRSCKAQAATAVASPVGPASAPSPAPSVPVVDPVAVQPIVPAPVSNEQPEKK
jgi:hypothetical protein